MTDIIEQAKEVDGLATLIKRYRGILKAIADSRDFAHTYIKVAPALGVMVDAPRYTDGKNLTVPDEAHDEIVAAMDNIIARYLAQAELLLSTKLK